MNILFDVGACQGDFTSSWLDKYPEGKAYCVEPDPENAKSLRQRFDGRNVEVVQKAVWIKEETRNLWSGTTSENASITIKNEAQFQNPNSKPTQVDCIKLSSLIESSVRCDTSTTFLKLDVEGVEFRCLQSIMGLGLVPNFIYFEDGCRKCMDINEWKARVAVYDNIHKQNMENQFFVEGNTKSNKNYLQCYDPVTTHQPYQIVKNGYADLNRVVNIFFEKAKEFMVEHAEMAPQIERIDFIFSWLTCHILHIHLKDGRVYETTTEHPVNSNKDTDIAVQFIQSISFGFEPSGNCSSRIDYLNFDECEKEMNVVLCRQGRDSLL